MYLVVGHAHEGGIGDIFSSCLCELLPVAELLEQVFDGCRGVPLFEHPCLVGAEVALGDLAVLFPEVGE